MRLKLSFHRADPETLDRVHSFRIDIHTDSLYVTYVNGATSTYEWSEIEELQAIMPTSV